jgi:hypothetical protein
MSGAVCEVHVKGIAPSTNRLGQAYRGTRKKTRVNYKEPKSGKGHTVALSATVAEALRAHRIEQAEWLLQPGIRATGDTRVGIEQPGRRTPQRCQS